MSSSPVTRPRKNSGAKVPMVTTTTPTTLPTTTLQLAYYRSVRELSASFEAVITAKSTEEIKKRHTRSCSDVDNQKRVGATVSTIGHDPVVWPSGIAVDHEGCCYVADAASHRILKVNTKGITTVLAGSGVKGYHDGVGQRAMFNGPRGLAVDLDGHCYVADRGNNRIRKISPLGIVTTLSGNGNSELKDGAAKLASFHQINGVAVDHEKNCFVTDSTTIRRVTAHGTVTTIVGAKLNSPWGIAVDRQGNLFVTDTFEYRVKKITPEGKVIILAGNGRRGYLDSGYGEHAMFDCPQGIAVDKEGNTYVADYENHRIRKIGTDGSVSTIAGTGMRGYVDGPVGVVEFDFPTGVAIDDKGNCYVSETHNKMPRKITFKDADIAQFAKVDRRKQT
jgi:DNA-binding beta-propeller fold protein YncE